MDKQKNVWIMFFHEAPDAPKRRTFAAVVFQDQAAYLACSTLSAKDQYNRRKGNDIALHRAVRCFEAMNAGLITTSQKGRFLNSMGKYGAFRIAALPGSAVFSNKRSAVLMLREALIRDHNFRSAPMKRTVPRLEGTMKEVRDIIQQAALRFLVQQTFGKNEEAPNDL